MYFKNTKFSQPNTHRTVMKNTKPAQFRTEKDTDYYNVAYFIDEHRAANDIEIIARNLLRTQGSNFFLNEYPSCTYHRIFIDIDAPMPDADIESIRVAIEHLTVRPVTFKILRNEKSNKAHIVTNIRTFTYDRMYRHKATMKYVRDYLYTELFDEQYSKQEWKKICDISYGIRSAFSVKFKGDQLVSTDRYLPVGMSTTQANRLSIDEKIDILVEYSIYGPAPNYFDKDFAEEIEYVEKELITEMQKNIEIREKLIAESQYKKNFLTINKVKHPVTQNLIDSLIANAPNNFQYNRGWRLILMHLKNVTAIFPKFNPTYFLCEWSAQNAKEFNHADNLRMWDAARVDDELAGASLTWLSQLGKMRLSWADKLKYFTAEKEKTKKNAIYFGATEIKSLEKANFNNDTTLIISPMGSGKSKLLRDYIKTIAPEIPIIFISFRRSFTSEIAAKMPDFIDYQTIDGIIDAPRVIIQYESLYRLRIPKTDYILILDESESIISQVEHKAKPRSFDNFEILIRNATKLIALDALAGERTRNLLQETRDSMSVFINKTQSKHALTRKYVIHENAGQFLAKMQMAILRARYKPIVLVTNSAKQSKVFTEKCAKINPNARVLLYNGESSEETRRTLANVNDHWLTAHILIYTSTISAGCSFERAHFTKMFVYATNKSTDYQTIIQMIGRIRDLRDNKIHVFINKTPVILPRMREEVIGAICNPTIILDSLKMTPLDFRCTLNAREVYEPRTFDLRLNMHIDNIHNRCQSQMHFLRLFTEAIYVSGATIIAFSGTKKSELVSAQKIALRQVTIKENADIASALETNADRLETIELIGSEKSLTLAQRNNSKKLYLINFYKIDPAKITPSFVAKYSRQDIQDVYTNLNWIATNTNSFEESLKNWLKVFLEKKSLNFATKNDNYKRIIACFIALKIANVIDSSQNYSNLLRFEDIYIHRLTLESRISEIMSHIIPIIDTLKLTFALRARDLQPKPTLKSQLGLINKILTGTLGLEIKNKRNDRDMYALCKCGLFKLVTDPQDSQNNRWIPNC